MRRRPRGRGDSSGPRGEHVAEQRLRLRRARPRRQAWPSETPRRNRARSAVDVAEQAGDPAAAPPGLAGAGQVEGGEHGLRLDQSGRGGLLEPDGRGGRGSAARPCRPDRPCRPGTAPRRRRARRALARIGNTSRDRARLAPARAACRSRAAGRDGRGRTRATDPATLSRLRRPGRSGLAHAVHERGQHAREQVADEGALAHLDVGRHRHAGHQPEAGRRVVQLRAVQRQAGAVVARRRGLRARAAATPRFGCWSSGAVEKLSGLSDADRAVDACRIACTAACRA